MDGSGSDTVTLLDKLQHCDDLDTFREYIQWLSEDKEAWIKKMNEIIQDNNYSLTEFAELCGVSRPAVAKWCKGVLPGRREDFIRIGFAAGYDLWEINFFLQRYGKFPALYAKSLEDSICIFVLNSEKYPHTYAFYLDVLSKVKEEMQQMDRETKSPCATVHLKNQLLTIDSLEELTNFVQHNAVSFADAYNKLYAYVQAFIIANNSYAMEEKWSVHALAKMQRWTSSLRQCVSAIRQKKWFPMRRKVIALGLHLNMTVDQINEMLGLAQMEALCAKNPVESAIIYAVEDAELNDMIYCDGSNCLCEYVKEVLLEIGIQDAEKVLFDL